MFRSLGMRAVISVAEMLQPRHLQLGALLRLWVSVVCRLKSSEWGKFSLSQNLQGLPEGMNHCRVGVGGQSIWVWPGHIGQKVARDGRYAGIRRQEANSAFGHLKGSGE
jgi:hypothetical protein